MLGSLISAGASIFGAISARDAQRDANQQNIQQAQVNREWQRDMYKKRYQFTVEDMRKAGLNPMLAYDHQPGNVGGGAQAQVESEHKNTPQMLLASAQANLLREQAKTEKTKQAQNKGTLPGTKIPLEYLPEWMRKIVTGFNNGITTAKESKQYDDFSDWWKQKRAQHKQNKIIRRNNKWAREKERNFLKTIPDYRRND